LKERVIHLWLRPSQAEWKLTGAQRRAISLGLHIHGLLQRDLDVK